ncbi:hypothetical protein M513_00857 [Trichuris suis]|uniref:Uncharacterized protein n=1 Tax=Trichuris suis TaxID=68888 RepID=A0A085MLJ8_9BILA|nr:hypothetical protein M513_00857 [Trichuris suis]
MIMAIQFLYHSHIATSRDELRKLDEWPQINGSEPMEMDQEG